MEKQIPPLSPDLESKRFICPNCFAIWMDDGFDIVIECPVCKTEYRRDELA